jgi:inward rectifier potassium channel
MRIFHWPWGRRRRPLPEIEVVGAPTAWAHDLYYLLLWVPWWADVLILTGVFLVANLAFAAAYQVVGGVQGAHGFMDLFYFSVETMGTIGYGEMFPASRGAHALVVFEALTQIFLLAVTTGIVFAKFSIPRARVEFAQHPVVAPYDGKPTLQIRIGNQRASRLIEAVMRVVMLRTERTREGVTMYRMYDIVLERDRSPALARSWTVLHHIDGESPLHGATPETLERDEVELIITLIGIDELSAQTLHAQARYFASQIRWGVRHADLLSELPDGRLRLDMTRFHHVVPTRKTETFPYGDDEV